MFAHVSISFLCPILRTMKMSCSMLLGKKTHVLIEFGYGNKDLAKIASWTDERN